VSSSRDGAWWSLKEQLRPYAMRCRKSRGRARQNLLSSTQSKLFLQPFADRVSPPCALPVVPRVTKGVRKRLRAVCIKVPARAENGEKTRPSSQRAVWVPTGFQLPKALSCDRARLYALYARGELRPSVALRFGRECRPRRCKWRQGCPWPFAGCSCKFAPASGDLMVVVTIVQVSTSLTIAHVRCACCLGSTAKWSQSP
jgi:hypothetical protein